MTGISITGTVVLIIVGIVIVLIAITAAKPIRIQAIEIPSLSNFQRTIMALLGVFIAVLPFLPFTREVISPGSVAPTAAPVAQLAPTETPAPTPIPVTSTPIPPTPTEMSAPTQAPTSTATSVPATNTPLPPTPTETPAPTPTIAPIFPTSIPATATPPISPRTDDTAPDFRLADTSGRIVELPKELATHNSIVLVFYRGHR